MRAVLLASVLATIASAAEPQTASSPLTLSQVVSAAVANYPSIRVSQEEMNAAAAGIRLARTAYLPRIDSVAQVNRATRNNIFGLLLPQTVIPSISGPVLGTNSLQTAWGSAAGFLVSWEPFDFGLRRANIEIAESDEKRSEAILHRTQFEVSVQAADAALSFVAAQQTVRAAQAAVDRAETLLRVVNAGVRAELRPGADASRADAEAAAARTQLIQAQQAVDIARTTVARFTGAEASAITIAFDKLSQLPSGAESAALDVTATPVAREQNAVIIEAQSRLRALERTYFPKFYLQGAAYARGSGAEPNGSVLGGFNGLGPNIQNYALGFTVSFPIMDLPSIHAREAAQSATVRSEQSRYQQFSTDLTAQFNAARVSYDAAKRVAQNTPVQVSSAAMAVKQASARYEAGLGNIVEVADAQRLLAQAEIDDAIAKLNVWRALLQIETIRGDIQPFLDEAGK